MANNIGADEGSPDGVTVNGGDHHDPEDGDGEPPPPAPAMASVTTPRGEKPPNSLLSAPQASNVSGSPNRLPRGGPPESDEDEDDEDFEEAPVRHGATNGGGYWRQGGGASRPHSPSNAIISMVDNNSDTSGPPPRPKSRVDVATSKYSNLSYWRARRVVFYKNGDPFFPGVEFRFKPGRDIGTLESLLDKLSLRMDLPRGARYIFSMDGDRKVRLDELEDGASYVVSSYKTFKVSALFFNTNVGNSWR